MTHPTRDLLGEVELFLATCRTATLATVDADGSPHAANVQYAHGPGLCLLWVSSPDSQHSQHVQSRADAAMTVYAHDDEAAHIHGLQLHGRVERIEGEAAWNDAWERYTAKFPFVVSMPQLRQAIEGQAFYRFTPNWVRWIDNRRGFGWKVEWSI